MTTSTCGIKRILQFKEAMVPGPIKVIDGGGLDVTGSCMYSWSGDGVCWTNWVAYQQYLQITKGVADELYIRILLFGSFEKASIHNVWTTCYSISLDCSSQFVESFCDNENLFNPYANLDCALQLQEQLSDSIICMLGIPVYYFRVKPDVTTADYTFKEYVLHNVESVKQIKLMIPDGAMPSSNPKYTALDFDWQVDWDVEVSKKQFATAFGDTVVPKTRDFIYIPMMNRMWKVNTAYDEKSEGLMWRSTTWKLSLVKYEESTNISTDNDTIQSLIDGWTVNDYDDVFGRKEEHEWERTTGSPQIQSPVRADNGLYNLQDISMQDAIRHKISKEGVSILDNQINHRSNIVARNIYKFRNTNSIVTYQKGYCGTDGTLSFILQTQGLQTTNNTLIKFGPIEVTVEYINEKYRLTFNGMSVDIDGFSTNLIILRWNKKTYSSSIDVYEYKHEGNVPKYMLRPEMYYFDASPVSSYTSTYNNDFEVCKEEPGFITPYPCLVTNIKLYNKDLGTEDSLKESIKYTTQHSACLINDLARPLSAGSGYAVK